MEMVPSRRWRQQSVVILVALYSMSFAVQKTVKARPYPIRLAGCSVKYRGRVEVYISEAGGWGSVCDHGWTHAAANLVCLQLGFTGAHEAVSSSKYGYNTGGFRIDNVTCTGTEKTLDECSNIVWQKTNCQWYEAAGVVCAPQKRKFFVALRGNPLERSTLFKTLGRVDVYDRKNNRVINICDSNWTREDAQVVCRQLGFSHGARYAATGRQYKTANTGLVTGNMVCTGNEATLLSCSWNWPDKQFCKSPAAGPAIVQCYPQRGLPGCYKDNWRDRDLKLKEFTFGDNTPAKCQVTCHERGYMYAGIQDSDKCFCGHDYGKYGKTRDQECNKLCSGNVNLKCGGKGHNWVMYSGTDCKDSRAGLYYRGEVSVTRSGKQCLFWKDKPPHYARNFCRNDNPNKELWCYVAKGAKRRASDICDVPTCTDCVFDAIGATYRGSISSTRGNIMCQSWDMQYPHTHPQFPEFFEENYCRNMDNVYKGIHPMPGLWCYTVDINVRWDFCNVPACPGTSFDNGVKSTTRVPSAVISTTTPSTTTIRTSPEPCIVTGCRDYGTCDFVTGTCSCLKGFGGKYCEIVLETCEEHPCRNGASCSDTPIGYRCTCAPTFTGSRCEVHFKVEKNVTKIASKSSSDDYVTTVVGSTVGGFLLSGTFIMGIYWKCRNRKGKSKTDGDYPEETRKDQQRLDNARGNYHQLPLDMLSPSSIVNGESGSDVANIDDLKDELAMIRQ